MVSRLVGEKVTSVEDVYRRALRQAESVTEGSEAIDWMIVAEKCWGIMHPVEVPEVPSPVFVAKVEVQEEPKQVSG